MDTLLLDDLEVQIEIADILAAAHNRPGCRVPSRFFRRDHVHNHGVGTAGRNIGFQIKSIAFGLEFGSSNVAEIDFARQPGFAPGIGHRPATVKIYTSG